MKKLFSNSASAILIGALLSGLAFQVSGGTNREDFMANALHLKEEQQSEMASLINKRRTAFSRTDKDINSHIRSHRAEEAADRSVAFAEDRVQLQLERRKMFEKILTPELYAKRTTHDKRQQVRRGLRKKS